MIAARLKTNGACIGRLREKRGRSLTLDKQQKGEDKER
jgi:hypothetical protein